MNISRSLSIDSNNRLVITESFRGRSSSSSKKAVSDIEFIRSKNESRPEKIVLDGRWSLTDGHQLQLRVHGSKHPTLGKTIILRGFIENVSSSSIIFRVKQADPLSGIRSSTIELRGIWASDRNNRLVFKVAKTKGKYDILRFQGTWTLNRSNEIIYRYKKTGMKTKTVSSKTLVFRGHWDFEKNRVTYRLEGSDDSSFTFKATLQSPSLRASDGCIKYQIGAAYTRSKTSKRLISIYGKWKLNRDFSASFEIARPDSKHSILKFEAESAICKNGSVIVSLKTQQGEKFGLEINFVKAFRNDAELFIALGHSAQETSIIGGIRVTF